MRRTLLNAVRTLAFASLLLAGCSDDLSVLNSVGNQLLRTRMTVKVDTFQAVSGSSFRQYLPMNGRVNLLGKSGGYTAYELLQFYPSYFPERDTVLVLSATLALRAETRFGDSLAPWGVNAYEISRTWGQVTFTWDSLAGIYDAGAFRGTAAASITSDTEWVKIPLDTAMVRRWLQPLNYSNNYGIILIPTLNCGVVRGFHEFDYDSASRYPQLTVIARSVGAGVVDTTVYNTGQDTFVGNIDTLISRTDLLYVQSGVGYRSRLLFDVSSIPRGAIINAAELDLYCDIASSRLNRFSSDSAVAVHALISATDSSLFEGLGARTTSSLATSDKFVLDIRHQVQNWIKNQSLNYGLLIRPANESEFTSFDLLTFFNQTAQHANKRPLLTVTYAVQSN